MDKSKVISTGNNIITNVETKLEFGDKLLTLDTRMSTIKKSEELLQQGMNGDEALLRAVLGDEQYKIVQDADLTAVGFTNLVLYIQSAVYGISFEEAQKQFRRQIIGQAR